MSENFHPDLIQIEIMTKDLAKSTRFYVDFLGWEIIPIEIFERVIFKISTHQKFGICLRLDVKSTENSHANVRLVFKTSKSQDFLEKITTFGGKLVQKLDPIPGYKGMYEIEDPDKNILVLAFS